MLDFLEGAGASRVALLPYHTFGVGKYKSLGRAYPLEGYKKLESKDLELLLGKVELPEGMRVEIREK